MGTVPLKDIVSVMLPEYRKVLSNRFIFPETTKGLYLATFEGFQSALLSHPNHAITVPGFGRVSIEFFKYHDLPHKTRRISESFHTVPHIKFNPSGQFLRRVYRELFGYEYGVFRFFDDDPSTPYQNGAFVDNDHE